MIELPDFEKAFEYENKFYQSCEITRLSKIISHYELFKLTWDLPGEIVECGVFMGNSLVRFASFRNMFGNAFSKKIIAFDTFAEFPETKFEDDINYRYRCVEDAGLTSLSVDQMKTILQYKRIEENVELIKGDITETVPDYVVSNPHLKISLLNLDTDIYEPAVTILEHLFPRIVRGGVIMLDDYNLFPGETKAVDDYFSDKNVRIKKHPFAVTPSYIIKE